MPDFRHQPPGLGDQALHVLTVTGQAHAGAARSGPCRPRYASTPGGGAGDLRRLAPVVALVGDEVLEDHLLQVAVACVDLGQRGQRGHALLLGLADPDQDPAGERDPQLAGGGDRLQAPRWVLGRRTGVDGLHQVFGHRLEHQALGRGHLAQAASCSRAITPRLVWGSMPRSSARSHTQTT